ncbi:uncharacterized protein [Maniola hyperantus]|uniref:uncharacterized protein n=1 Tax=Aphantopus hyperantus TaxID=2795564 RepID=UPI0015694C19|nr:uncharacterized protein LOC117987378 [Maniola hyperantus]XP_034830270.1 uncharacterized protein LOC117987378 [Maniola hyperantus]
MWCPWIALLVSCALAVAEEAEGPVATGPVTTGPQASGPLATGPLVTGPVATTRAPPRTLDRQLGELAWPSWIKSSENNNQNTPPRRITTKSLFITPLVCPKGHRLDGSACVQVLTVNKDDHESILLQELNALFTSAPNNGDVVYDYGDEDPGPLQLSIPIGIDPLQESSPQAQEYAKLDKKGDNTDASVEAELELLKLQQAQYAKLNITQNGNNILSHNLLHNLLSYSDKPKRDSPMINSTEVESSNNTDEGQKELVFGQVNVDPVLYDTENQNNQAVEGEYETEKTNEQLPQEQNDAPTVNNTNTATLLNDTSDSTAPISKKVTEAEKLNPENDYSDIGEAIKLISRYAEVSTDDNFTKDDKTVPSEDSILGTRTKLQHRRNKPKLSNRLQKPETPTLDIVTDSDDVSNGKIQQQNVVYYRYPWPSENSGSQPSNYPFRHLQDYWPGRSQVGGVYSTMHGNPRRHHHSYPHYFRPRGYQYVGYTDTHPGFQEAYSGLRRYPHKIVGRDSSPIRSHANNQDLYSLLGLRHWFSSERATKR